MAMQQAAADRKLRKAVARKKFSRRSSRFSVILNINNAVIPYARLCDDIAQNIFHEKIVFEDEAIEAIQAATESFIILLMQGAALMCRHAGRNTVKKEDFAMFQKVINTMTPPLSQAGGAPLNLSDGESTQEQCVAQ
ncbi:hypothetical protein FSHL1_010489 [Fusarium sambucinum]